MSLAVAAFGNALPGLAWAADDCAGTAATRQGVTAFSALLDGQPGTAGQPQLTLAVSAAPNDDQAQVSYGFTPGARRFACDMLLSLVLPAVARDGALLHFESSFGVSWEQRWRADDASGPTLSTFTSLQIPLDSSASASQLMLTGVVARSFRPGTLYLNVSVATQQGIGAGDWQTTLLAGWRHDLPNGHAVILDAGLQDDGDRHLEAGLQIAIGASLTVGPGVSWAEDRGRNATTFGIVLQRTLGP